MRTRKCLQCGCLISFKKIKREYVCEKCGAVHEINYPILARRSSTILILLNMWAMIFFKPRNMLLFAVITSLLFLLWYYLLPRFIGLDLRLKDDGSEVIKSDLNVEKS